MTKRLMHQLSTPSFGDEGNASYKNAMNTMSVREQRALQRYALYTARRV